MDEEDDDASVSVFTVEGTEEKGVPMDEEQEGSTLLAPSSSSSSSSSSAVSKGTRNAGVSPGEGKGRVIASRSAERGAKQRGRKEEVVSDEEGHGEGEGGGEGDHPGVGDAEGEGEGEGEGDQDQDQEGSVSIYSIGSDEDDDGYHHRDDLVRERPIVTVTYVHLTAHCVSHLISIIDSVQCLSTDHVAIPSLDFHATYSSHAIQHTHLSG